MPISIQIKYLTKIVTLVAVLFSGSLFAQNAANPKVLMETSLGNVTIELYADKAPGTVSNFLSYVDDGFFSGTIFHRVIGRFMVQGGGFDANFQKKPTKDPIKNEADNGLKNEAGTLAMARTNDPHSATSQFFINVVNNSYLDFTAQNPRGWGYCVFGKVINGMDVVKLIENTPTGSGGPFPKDVPQQTIFIKSVKRI